MCLAIILCRTGSKRLKNKHFLKLKKDFIIDVFINRLKRVNKIKKIVLATSTKKKDRRSFSNLAKKHNIKIFFGSENDVLGRLTESVKKYGKKNKIIIRANADNPLIMPTIINSDIKRFIKSKKDLYTPFDKNKIPFGFSLTIFKKEILFKLNRIAKQKKYREHVENYCLDNPKKFSILRSKKINSLNASKLILTLDTIKDYIFIKKVYDKIYDLPYKYQPNLVLKKFIK